MLIKFKTKINIDVCWNEIYFIPSLYLMNKYICFSFLFFHISIVIKNIKDV
jgi:hypothetical protein